ncbi:MAG: hypothetical protein IIC02_11300, partial [Planctomycetes bacterium]|nr:hypothetical protein [Planctomycetota bacterium]
MRQDSPMTVPPRRGLLRRIPRLCKILALGLAVSTLALAAPRGTGGSLYPQETALEALADGDVTQRGGQICPEPPSV